MIPFSADRAMVAKFDAAIAPFMSKVGTMSDGVKRFQMVSQVGFSDIEARANRTGQALVSLRSIAAGLGAAVGAGISFFASRAFIDLADQAKSLENQMRGIGAASDDTRKAIYALAIETRTPVEDTVGLLTRMQKSLRDQPLEQTIRQVGTLNRLLITGGLDNAARGSVALQFGQALQSGVLQGDELRSLREAAPYELLDAIAKAAGGTVEQLRDLGAQGKLTRAVMVQALEDLERTSRDKLGAFNMTVAEASDALRTGLLAAVGEFDSGLGATDALAGAMQGLAQFMHENAGAAEVLGEALKIVGQTALLAAGTRGIMVIPAAASIATARLTALAASGVRATAVFRGLMSLLGGPWGAALFTAGAAAMYLRGRNDDSSAAVQRLQERFGLLGAEASGAAADVEGAAERIRAAVARMSESEKFQAGEDVKETAGEAADKVDDLSRTITAMLDKWVRDETLTGRVSEENIKRIESLADGFRKGEMSAGDLSDRLAQLARDNRETFSGLAAGMIPFLKQLDEAVKSLGQIKEIQDALSAGPNEGLPPGAAAAYREYGASRRTGAWLATSEATQAARDMIAAREGFRTDAYPDYTVRNGQRVVDAYRAGYGSDTGTRADGSVYSIQKGMSITAADAARDLDRRIQSYFSTIIGQIGQTAFEGLSAPQKGALASLLHNYGEGEFKAGGDLAGVVAALQSGNQQAVADAIAARGADNSGINRGRRIEEAQAFGGASESQVEALDALKKHTDARKDFNESLEVSAARQQLDISLIGKSAAEQARAITRFDLMNDAKRMGIDLDEKVAGSTKTYREQIEDLAAAAAQAALDQEKLEESTKRLLELQENAAEGKELLISMFTDSASAAGRLEDALKRAVVQLLLFNEGALSVGGNWGGLLGGFDKGAGKVFGWLGSLFASGGIMTGAGPVDLPMRAYAAGGIANSPQMAIFGEGDMPEAYVPLPDGRSIPVTIRMPDLGGMQALLRERAEISQPQVIYVPQPYIAEVGPDDDGRLTTHVRRESAGVTALGMQQQRRALPGQIRDMQARGIK
ncbi:tape measure protein [Paracoccus versutus]|uniref:Lysozyme n=1 Tax=Paracoccus versutus TaxID=34007 RepID=A0A3D9XJ78_PARVE|nr:tape measure protein [Paracoccus versutus]REF69651.1 tape measure domain-containing protein [Paracoccus versutus]WGR57977.1 hypothetical protein E3U25_18740 [Paracoccus versutus]